MKALQKGCHQFQDAAAASSKTEPHHCRAAYVPQKLVFTVNIICRRSLLGMSPMYWRPAPPSTDLTCTETLGYALPNNMNTRHQQELSECTPRDPEHAQHGLCSQHASIQRASALKDGPCLHSDTRSPHARMWQPCGSPVPMHNEPGFSVTLLIVTLLLHTGPMMHRTKQPLEPPAWFRTRMLRHKVQFRFAAVMEGTLE